jgi:hypothetical protein
VIGQGLPPSAGLSAARSVVYPGGVNLTGPLVVLAIYAAAGTLLTLAATAWRRHRAAARAPQPAEPLPPTIVGKALRGRRDGVVLATRCVRGRWSRRRTRETIPTGAPVRSAR